MVGIARHMILGSWLFTQLDFSVSSSSQVTYFQIFIMEVDSDVELLSDARLEDKKYIQELERDLKNCSVKIGTLQNQLNLRNIESNWLGEHVHSLELKLSEMGKIQEKAKQLREELLRSNSQRLSLMRELEEKEMKLQNSALCIEKLEEAISSIALESECEIESMKLDLINLEQVSSEASEFQEKATQEKARMDRLIKDFAAQIQDSQQMIELLEEENRDLRNRLKTSDSISRTCIQRIEEYLKERLEKDRSHSNFLSCGKLDNELLLSKETGNYEEVLGPLLSKLAAVAASDENMRDEIEKMSQQTHTYKLLVEQLKDELRKEKLKAKEEAEDLTQEMAELRYQITGMLEQECKRRAFIEQTSMQRIAELEAQYQKEQMKSSLAAKRLFEAEKLAESRSGEIHYLKHLLEGSCTNPQRNEVSECGECNIFAQERSEAEHSADNSLNYDKFGQLSIACIPEESRLSD